MRAVANTLAGAEAELQKERASALGRSGQNLERALTAFHEAEARGDDLTAVRAEAQKRLWYLIVQREALGLYRHRETYEAYAIPKAWQY